MLIPVPDNSENGMGSACKALSKLYLAGIQGVNVMLTSIISAA